MADSGIVYPKSFSEVPSIDGEFIIVPKGREKDALAKYSALVLNKKQTW